MANAKTKGCTATRATRNYLVKTPGGLFPAVVEQGYIPEQGGGEIARLRRLFPEMIGAFIVA
jgi:actin-like ATPase involved in cell morphogenesis